MNKTLWPLVVLALGACGAPSTGTDAGSMPGTDSGNAPGTDSGVPGTDTGTPGVDGGGPTGGFRAIPLNGDDERVTGIYCTAPNACVVTATSFAEPGHLYSTDGHALTGTLLTGDATFAEPLGTLGDVGFEGFSLLGNRLVVHVQGAEAAWVTATSDYTNAASWSSVRIGAGDQFALNGQFGFGQGGGHTTFCGNGRIWDSTETPGPSALFTNIWSPNAVGPIPADIDDQRTADPTLCNTDPNVSTAEPYLQSIYIAPDIGIIVSPAGALNQLGDDTPGVCISTDGGHHFHHVEFPGIEMGRGPNGVFCTSTDHCIAYGDGYFVGADQAFIYVSNNASMGSASTWTKATTPSLVQDTRLRDVFFAPDHTTGWLVGAAGSGAPLLLQTTDGGATWTDQTSMIRALAADVRLSVGYAYDATHVWIGGEHDTLLTIGN